MADKIQLTPEQFKEMLAEQMKAVVAEMGLDKIDKKFGVMPTDDDPNGEEFKNLKPGEKVQKFFKAVVMNDGATIKALGEGVDSAGGYLVPEEFKNMLIEALPDYTVMRQIITVMPVGTLTGTIPSITAKPGAEWGSENTAMNEQSATFGEVAYALNRLQSLIPMSRELVADANVNMVQLITRLFAEAFGTAEDNAITTGDGTGKPVGFTTASLSSVAVATAGTTVLGDLTNLLGLVKAQYRKRGQFLTSPAGVQVLRKLVDGNGNPILYTPANSDVSTLFGKPVIENVHIPENLGAGTDETEIYFGDFSYYYLFDRGEYAVESTMDGYGAFEKHQIVMKAFNRMDGKIGLTEPIAKLTGVK